MIGWFEIIAAAGWFPGVFLSGYALAGRLGLGKLIYLYDNNSITIIILHPAAATPPPVCLLLGLVLSVRATRLDGVERTLLSHDGHGQRRRVGIG